MFDACIEYLACNHIAILRYTVLRRIICQAIKQERKRIGDKLGAVLSDKPATNLANLVDSKNILTVKELKQAAKSFTAPELQKELNVDGLIQLWMQEVDRVVSALSLSLENQPQYASLVDYYSIAKLKRFDSLTQQSYFLCYLKEQAQINVERIDDGFIYHVRKLREKPIIYNCKLRDSLKTS